MWLAQRLPFRNQDMHGRPTICLCTDGCIRTLLLLVALWCDCSLILDRRLNCLKISHHPSTKSNGPEGINHLPHDIRVFAHILHLIIGRIALGLNELNHELS
jgi:hypothetical protein